jgi:dTDP-4-amino-4,6-dideoxygalactose transaminase
LSRPNIVFNKPTLLTDQSNFSEGISSIATGKYIKKSEEILSRWIGGKALLTPSCTAALEMCALALELGPEDEVIIPSFTFVTTASAFALRGSRLVYVDICADTQNIDENQILAAITNKTKAIVVVHYAGISCNMKKITKVCRSRNIALIEDAAQCIYSFQDNRHIGHHGDFACFSFHHTKNINAGGEGGALIVNNSKFDKVIELIQEKGTDRSRLLRGEIDKYTWQTLSSSYVISDIQAFILHDQLSRVFAITQDRLCKYEYYKECLHDWAEQNNISLPFIPKGAKHNAHIFYLKFESEDHREAMRQYLIANNIFSTTHYEPLHLSPAGRKYGSFYLEDKNTTFTSKVILRLPLYNELNIKDVEYICYKIKHFKLANVGRNSLDVLPTNIKVKSTKCQIRL